MPYFNNPKILLIHIPKTGGTSVETYLSKKYKIELNVNSIYYEYYFKNHDLTHQNVMQLKKTWETKLIQMIENEKNNIKTNIKFNKTNMVKSDGKNMVKSDGKNMVKFDGKNVVKSDGKNMVKSDGKHGTNIIQNSVKTNINFIQNIINAKTNTFINQQRIQSAPVNLHSSVSMNNTDMSSVFMGQIELYNNLNHNKFNNNLSDKLVNTPVPNKIASSNSVLNSNKNIEKWKEIKQSLLEFRNFQKANLSLTLLHSLQHFTWIEIRKYKDILFDNAVSKSVTSNILSHRNGHKIITIVRNPYDRIISELFFIKLLNPNTVTQQSVYLQLVQYFNSTSTFDNHKLPQYLFLVDENGNMPEGIIIFKTETLTEQMHQHGFTDFSENLNITVNCKINPATSTKYAALLNSQSIKLINEYYAKDFEMFHYPLLPQ